MKNVFQATTPIRLAVLLCISLVFICAKASAATAQTENVERDTSGDTSVPKHTNPHQIDIQINLDSVAQQVNAALSKIDFAKVNSDVQKAMASIDYKKMNQEINVAMKTIDWKALKQDVAKSLDSAKTAINKIDWDKVHADINKAQSEAKREMALHHINSDSLKQKVQQSLHEAQKNLQAAQAGISVYHNLPNALQKDGLIDKGKPYTIELRNGSLYLNGVKQSASVTERYSRYYAGKQNFIIKEQGAANK